MDRPAPLIVITGPTGSGKTDLALRLAGRFALEVISADSMQVYRHMDIATAKPTPEEQRRLKHHLIDVINPDQEFNAGLFASQARALVEDITTRGATPVVVGGTGLYIQALLYGLSASPPQCAPLRRALASLKDRRGQAFLRQALVRLDPAAAGRIAEGDTSRTVRCLEVILLTGQRLSDLNAHHGFRVPCYASSIFCLMPEREELYAAIEDRVERMLAAGLLAETRALLERGYGVHLRSMRTLAYKHVVGVLNGVTPLDEARRLIQRDTRRYAKRQITWCRGHYESTCFYGAEGALRALAARLGP